MQAAARAPHPGNPGVGAPGIEEDLFVSQDIRIRERQEERSEFDMGIQITAAVHWSGTSLSKRLYSTERCVASIVTVSTDLSITF